MPAVFSLIRRRHLAWLPAAALVSVGLLSAVGVSLTPNGHAATAVGSTIISASVLPEVSLDLAQNAAGTGTDALCTAGTGVMGGTANNETAEFGKDINGQRISIAGSGITVLGSCSMTFGTNNGASGVTLSVKSARAAGSTFCKSANGANCVLAAYTDDTGADNTLEADRFGIRPTSIVCDNGPTPWTVGNYYGAPLSGAAGADICTENASATSTLDAVVVLEFAVNTSTMTSGNYYGQLNFTATAA